MDKELFENVQKCYTRHVFRKCGLGYVLYADHIKFLDGEPLEIR